MQRFKNLTKKSGKVASAILSAAMVTSMVLGTNAVEVKAATNDTQDETNVQGVKSVKDLAEAAKASYISSVQITPVNVSQAAIGTTGNTDYWEYMKGLGSAVAEQYNGEGHTVTITPTAITITKEPTITDSGVAKLTFEVAAKDSADNWFGYTDVTAATAEIKLDSYQERINKATEVTNTVLKDYNFNNKTTANDVSEAVKKALDEQKYLGEYALYDDIDVITASAFEVNKAKADADGYAEGSVELKALKANGTAGQYAHGGNVPFKKGIDSNLTRAKKATADLQTYYTSEDLRSTGVNTTTASVLGITYGSSSVSGSALSYLAASGYTDMNGEVVTSGAVSVVTGSYVLVDKASSDLDGKATIGYQVQVGTSGDEQKAPAVENLDITLKSDKTIAEQIVKDIKTVADDDDFKSGINGSTTAGAFTVKLNDAFHAKYRKYYQLTEATDFNKTMKFFEATGATAPTEILNASASPSLQKTLYPDTTDTNDKEFKVTMNFVPKDAGADRDGDGKLSISVTVGGENATDSVAYDSTSNQTEADKAKTAVEEALRAYPVTNATTDEDLKKVVDDAVRDYDVHVEVFTSDRTTATAEKEGSIDVKVLITSTKNNELKRTAEVNETLTIAKEYKNAFEIKDGKKYYHDENGNLLKNTFLQGTDSPDGYTYYIQNDGSVMQDRLTYHPNGKDVIYFDKDGHEVFDAFVNVKKDVQGNDVDYIGYFGTLGGAYINQTTYGNGEGAYSKDALFYINDYGVLENKGWFQNAAGNIGYAAPNGTLTTNTWGFDQFGRKVYFQADGFLAKGLITDGVKYYQLDENDGHLVGEF